MDKIERYDRDRVRQLEQEIADTSDNRFVEHRVAPAQAAPAQPKTAVCAQCETPIHKRKDDNEWVHEDNTMECFLGHSVKAWPKWDRSTLRVVEAEAPRGDQESKAEYVHHVVTTFIRDGERIARKYGDEESALLFAGLLPRLEARGDQPIDIERAEKWIAENGYFNVSPQLLVKFYNDMQSKTQPNREGK